MGMMIIKVTVTNKGILYKASYHRTADRTPRTSEPQVTELISANKVSALFQPQGWFFKEVFISFKNPNI